MKRLASISLLLVAVLRADPGVYFPEGWTLGTVFPSKPTLGARPLDDGGTMFSAICQSPSEAFIGLRVRYEAVIEKAKLEAAFESGKEAMLRSMSAILVSQKSLTVCGYPARHYVLEEKTGKRKAEYYVVIAGDEIYQFAHAAKREVEDSPAVKSFFAEIAVLQKKG